MKYLPFAFLTARLEQYYPYFLFLIILKFSILKLFNFDTELSVEQSSINNISLVLPNKIWSVQDLKDLSKNFSLLKFKIAMVIDGLFFIKNIKQIHTLIIYAKQYS